MSLSVDPDSSDSEHQEDVAKLAKPVSLFQNSNSLVS